MAVATSTTAAVLYGVEDIRLEERPMPVPRPDEVLVEIRSVGICGSDIHYYREGRIGDFVVDAPLILGHESSGVVIAVGSDVDEARVGRLVALEPGVPDGTCSMCRRGDYNLCPDVRFLATPPIDGALVRHLAHPAAFSYDVPDGVSEDAAALLEPLSVGIWACRKAGVAPGDRVLVTGGGPIGLLCAAVARASGAAEIIVSDPVPERRRVAARYGATATIDPGEDGTVPRVDVLLECSGVAPAIEAGIRAVRPAGRAVLVGMTAAPTTALPLGVLQSREITLTGTFRYASTYPAAIGLAASGAVDLDGLAGRHYTLAGTQDALTVSSADPSVIKPVVKPQQ